MTINSVLNFLKSVKNVNQTPKTLQRFGTVLPYQNHVPKLARGVYLAPGSVVTGQVELAENVNIWCNAVLRGDVHWIKIGENTNIQDNVTCHVTRETHPLDVGKNVTIGHNAILHGCKIGDGALVGMGAIVLDEAVIEPAAMVAAGAVVTPRTVVKSGEIWAGNPAKKLRNLNPAEADWLTKSAAHYVKTARDYQNEDIQHHNENLTHQN